MLLKTFQKFLQSLHQNFEELFRNSNNSSTIFFFRNLSKQFFKKPYSPLEFFSRVPPRVFPAIPDKISTSIIFLKNNRLRFRDFSIFQLKKKQISRNCTKKYWNNSWNNPWREFKKIPLKLSVEILVKPSRIARRNS